MDRNSKLGDEPNVIRSMTMRKNQSARFSETLNDTSINANSISRAVSPPISSINSSDNAVNLSSKSQTVGNRTNDRRLSISKFSSGSLKQPAADDTRISHGPNTYVSIEVYANLTRY
jgi:hypothetical protein